MLLNKAKEKNLFNFDWFQDFYNIKFDNEEECFEYYLSNSQHSNINPSFRFDNLKYLQNNLDVDMIDMSPLQHFIEYGEDEGRLSFDVDTVFNEFSHGVHYSSSHKELKIAIVLHIFYADFIEKFDEAISSFPQRVDVLITASSDDIAEQARSIFSSNEKVNYLEVKSVPNIGRNFGPMLVEYSSKLLEYDLFAHLHSKKSLYSGKEQNKWSNYTLSYLLSNAKVTSQVINAFSQDASIGMYFPITFRGLPFWANHWLKNFGIARHFFPDVEIKNTLHTYPASGMFWARPKSLEAILSRTYSYDDFPPEPLPNDGSYLHALERVVTSISEASGYRNIYYYPEKGALSFSDEYVTYGYENVNYQQVNQRLNNHDSISFDLYDTIFVRKFYFPDLAKVELGNYLVELGLYKESKQFVKIRNDAEFEIRKEKGFSGDVDIIEIYERIIRDDSNIKLDSKDLAQMEFEKDLKNYLPRREMIDLIKDLSRKGKKIMFVTDIYYTKEQILQVLEYCGVDISYELYVSSDLRLRKDNGSMWVYLNDMHDLTGNNHIHLGDNLVSDVQIPGDMGIHNQPLLNPMDKWLLKHSNISRDCYDIYSENAYFWGRQISINGYNPFLR